MPSEVPLSFSFGGPPPVCVRKGVEQQTTSEDENISPPPPRNQIGNGKTMEFFPFSTLSSYAVCKLRKYLRNDLEGSDVARKICFESMWFIVGPGRKSKQIDCRKERTRRGKISRSTYPRLVLLRIEYLDMQIGQTGDYEVMKRRRRQLGIQYRINSGNSHLPFLEFTHTPIEIPLWMTIHLQ